MDREYTVTIQTFAQKPNNCEGSTEIYKTEYGLHNLSTLKVVTTYNDQ